MNVQLRAAAYGICVREDSVLLARWLGPTGPQWTLPGGHIEHGEWPQDAVVREVQEETGLNVRVASLLGFNSWLRRDIELERLVGETHMLQVIFECLLIRGELRNEVDGSTDLAAWVDLGEVANLDRVPLVDVGLGLYRARPAEGRLL